MKLLGVGFLVGLLAASNAQAQIVVGEAPQAIFVRHDPNWRPQPAEKQGSANGVYGFWPNHRHRDGKLQPLLVDVRADLKYDGFVRYRHNHAVQERFREALDLAQSFVPYENSSLAVSPDGRWLAVSGNSIKLSMASKDPEILTQHYRIHLIDLSRFPLKIANQTAMGAPEYGLTLFDTYVAANFKSGGEPGGANGETIPFAADQLSSRAVQRLVRQEFQSLQNPFVAGDGDPYFENYQWGVGAKLELQFTPDSRRLYVRVWSGAPVGRPAFKPDWERRDHTGFRSFVTTELPQDNFNFLKELDDRNPVSLQRAFRPGASYLAGQVYLQGSSTLAAFTASPNLQHVARIDWKKGMAGFYDSCEANAPIRLFGGSERGVVLNDPFIDRQVCTAEKQWSSTGEISYQFNPQIEWRDDGRIFFKMLDRLGWIRWQDVVEASRREGRAAENASDDFLEEESKLYFKPITVPMRTSLDSAMRLHGLTLQSTQPGFFVKQREVREWAIHGDLVVAITGEYRQEYQFSGPRIAPYQRDLLPESSQLNRFRGGGFVIDTRNNELWHLLYPQGNFADSDRSPARQHSTLWQDLYAAQSRALPWWRAGESIYEPGAAVDSHQWCDANLCGAVAWQMDLQRRIDKRLGGSFRLPKWDRAGRYLYFVEIRDASEAWSSIRWPTLSRVDLARRNDPHVGLSEGGIERLTASGWLSADRLGAAVDLPKGPLMDYLFQDADLPTEVAKTWPLNHLVDYVIIK